MADGTLAPPGKPQDGLFSRPYAVATICFSATMFLTGFAALAVVPTLPTAARELDGVSLFPLVAGSFVAASLLGGVLGGNWADRAGARRPLAAGMALTVVTLLVAASSTTIWQLVAGRFLDGLAAGMVAVSINTAIGEAYPDRLRPRAMALMSTSWVIPSLTGPPLAGLVTEWWSWRAVFYVLAALTVLPSLALVVVVRKRAWAGGDAPVDEKAPRPALFTAAVVSVGAALGQYGVSGWSPQHGIFALGALALLAVLAPRLLPPGTWRAARGLPATVLLRGMGSGTFFTIEAFVPLMLIDARGAPAVTVGLFFTGAAVIWAAASFVQGRLLEHWPRHRLVAIGSVLLALAVAIAVVGTLPEVPRLTAGAAMLVAAAGMGVLEPSLVVLSLSHSPPGRRGYASGAMQTTMNLGQITVLGLFAAALNVGLAAGVDDMTGYALAFALLLVPGSLPLLLSGRVRAG
ncbi:MFS transporter [Streptomyces sp. NPDC057638]|uniref:MFS transporter n=1 Tax=Streptomyces sp. NPDC057638 TaxID=3346190 RepID=UPI00369666B5